MRKQSLLSLIPLALLVAAQPFAQSSTGAVNIADYGAVGDGVTCDNVAFQDAIVVEWRGRAVRRVRDRQLLQPHERGEWHARPLRLRECCLGGEVIPRRLGSGSV